MSRSMFSRRGPWVLFVLFGLIPYCVGADGFCTPVSSTTPTDTGNNDTGQVIPAVNGSPRIVFSSPAGNSTYSADDSVVVTLTANDPENDFDWSLFYDRDGVFNGNEVAIQSGSRTGSSLVQAIWPTSGLQAGTYYLWALVTDSGGNTDRTSVGPITLTSTAVTGSIQVTSPASSVAVSADGAVSIAFSASNAPAGSTINVFYDTDGTFSNGVAGTIASSLSSGTTSAVWSTTGVAAGVYYIGASLGTGSTGRVAAYAPGQVTVGSTTPVTPDQGLEGLSILVTAPAGTVVVNKGATVAIQFKATDSTLKATGSTGTATVDLYYVALNSDGSTPAYTGKETKIAAGLALTATSYTWIVNLDPGVYQVGGTIGRSATPRLTNMAPGKVQVASGGGGGGGGGGSTTPTLTMQAPANTTTPAPITRNGEYQILWTPSVDGKVSLWYALDDDKNRAPDTGAAWTQFTADVKASLGKAKFTPSSIPLTRGTYMIKGILTPSDGSAAVEALAPGWIGIEETTIIAPLTPVQVDRAKPTDPTGKAGIEFTMTNPTPSPMTHSFVLATRSTPVGTDYQQILVTPAYPTTGLTTDPVKREIMGAQLLTGLNFLTLAHQVTNNIGVPGAYTDPVNVSVPVYVYDSASQARLTKAITMLKPSRDVDVTEGDTLEVSWFVPELPTGPGDTVTLFYQRLDSSYQPTGEMIPFSNGSGLNPLTCYAKMATGNIAYTLEDLLVGAKYVRGLETTISYAPGLLHMRAKTDRTLQVTGPARNMYVLSVGGPVKVEWTAVDPAGRSDIRVFFDHDSTVNGDEVEIARDLAITEPGKSSGSYTFSTTTANGGHPMLPGLYFIGASLGPNDTNRTAAYSLGRLLILKSGETMTDADRLSVRTPAGAGDSRYITAIQGNPIKVSWFVNDAGHGAPNSGSCQVFAEPDANEDDQPDGEGARIPPDMFTPNMFSPYEAVCMFKTAPLVPGKSYFFGVKYTDGAGEKFVKYAPAKVRIVANSIWIGNLGGNYLSGTVFEGVNYYDLAGSSMAPIKDIDGDGYDDFVIVAQFGKPGWDGFGIDGASVGEAYVIYGDPSLGSRPRWKLNATGTNVIDPTNGLPGFVLTGLESVTADPDNPLPSDRGGISGVLPIPDQDEDGSPELLFSFPRVRSHSSGILTREGQFVRGGYVEISSRSPYFRSRTTTDGVGGRTYRLSNVGQNFNHPYPDRTQPSYDDRVGCKDVTDEEGKVTVCAACCIKKGSGADPECHDETKGTLACGPQRDTVIDPGIGFSKELATAMAFLGWVQPECSVCKSASEYGTFQYDASHPGCDAVHNPALGAQAEMSTGFYLGTGNCPYGLRMLGQTEEERFASSLSWVDDMLLVGSPNHGSANGKVYRFQLVGKVNELEKRYGDDRGDLDGPRPYQYIADPSIGFGNCHGVDGSPMTIFTNSASGDTGRLAEGLGMSVSGVADFNNDGLGDYVLGAPGASIAGNASCGAVYLVYRRASELDTDRDLKEIELGQTSAGRKIGAMIHGRAGEYFGEVVGTGADVNADKTTEKLDLNRDGAPDLVMGNYQYDGHRGEIVVLFGNANLESPLNGYGIDDLLTHLGSDSKPDLGCVIRGEQQGDDAGFNISYAGDFDGDGTPDLLIAAPNASAQVDINGDGVLETLLNAGKVYLILGSNKFVPGGRYSLAMVGKPDDTTGTPADAYDFTKTGIKGLVFSGQHPGDNLGGGEVKPYDPGQQEGIGATGMRARSISWAGDANGDGLSDLLIGAPMAGVTTTSGSVSFAGEVYLVFGFPMTN